MSASLPSFAAPDAYGTQDREVGFLRCQDTVRIRISVSNQPIFWQRGFGRPGGNVQTWEPEEQLLPVTASLTERCDFIRVRAAFTAAELKALEAKEGKPRPQAMVTISTRSRSELS